MHSLHYTLLARGTRSQLAHLHHRLNLRVKIADDARLVELDLRVVEGGVAGTEIAAIADRF